MALVTCPECGREKVSDTALACPGCGYPIKEHFEKINKGKEKDDNLEQVSQEIEKPEEDITIKQKSENDTATSVVDKESNKDEKKNKKAILIGAVALVILFLLAVTNIDRGEKKIDISKIDMTTSLIKGDSIISADKAYKLVQERLMDSLGNGYDYEVKDDGGYIGIFKKGDSEYSYIITCTTDKDNGEIIPSDSNKQPKCVNIYDCTSADPNEKSLGMLISTILDNADQSVIKAVLVDKKQNSLNESFPDEFAVAINGKVYYVTSDTGLKHAYMIELAGDYYDYGKINPLAALDYIFRNDETARDKIIELPYEDAKSLVKYYMDHEQEYYEDFDSLLKKAGMKKETESTDSKKTSGSKEEENNNSYTYKSGSSDVIISPTANKVYTCAQDVYKFMCSFEAKPRDTNIFDLASKQTSLDSAIEALEKSGADPEILAAAKTISRRVSSWSDVAMSFMALHSSLDDLSSARADVKSAIDDFVELAK